MRRVGKASPRRSAPRGLRWRRGGRRQPSSPPSRRAEELRPWCSGVTVLPRSFPGSGVCARAGCRPAPAHASLQLPSPWPQSVASRFAASPWCDSHSTLFNYAEMIHQIALTLSQKAHLSEILVRSSTRREVGEPAQEGAGAQHGDGGSGASGWQSEASVRF